MAEIKINVEQLEKDLKTLNQSIKEFEPYSKDFVKNTREVFDGFNSDFIAKMDSVIKHLSDDVAKDIVEAMQDIYSKTDGIVTSFKEFDEQVIKDSK